MADYTTTYAIDNLQEYPVYANFDGVMRVLVQENTDSTHPASADLLMRGRVPGSGQVRVAMGTPAVFSSGPYAKGQKVGTVQTSSGSITVQQVETKTI